jgi:hypothetical protein
MPDELRDLLAGLPRATSIPTPPGYVALIRRLAIDAGADGEALDAWVAEHGGVIRRTKPGHAGGRSRNRGKDATVPGEQYYALPSTALR